jgi:hypothetical protein
VPTKTEWQDVKKKKDRAPGRRQQPKHRQKAGPSTCGQLVERMEPRQLLSTYYVSTAGADTNAGSLASPFRTIQRAAGIAQPGDTVLIRGGTYRETVVPANSGAAGAPITFSAYNGEQVVVSGADPVGGWNPAGGAVYSATVPWMLGPGADQVLVDGRMINEARWPNTSLDVSHPTSARAASISANNGVATLYDPSLTQPAGYWNGAYIHLFPGQGWVAETGQVRSSQPGQLTFSYQENGESEHPSAGDNYYLFGKFQALDAPGEFYHDPTTGKLYIWTPASDSPAAHLIEVKHRDYAFDLRGVSDIRLDGVGIQAATITTDAGSSRIVIDHLRASYTSQFQLQPSGWDQPKDSGIALMGDNDVLQDSVIEYSAGDGVYVGGTNDRVTNVTIHDVNYNGGDSAGVRIVAAYAQVDHNTIYNAGRDGIGQFGWDTHILYNTIHDVMLQGTDGGGIYTVRSNGGGSEIAYNRIYNAISGGYGAAGIYLDNDSSNYVIHHNVVWNVNAAMKINYSSQNEQIYNNTLDAVGCGIQINQVSDWSGSTIVNNIFFRLAQLGTGATVSGNIFANTDPKVVNRPAADYRLKSGSPAIAQGVPLPTSASGRPDIGALAYGSAVFPSGASPIPIRSGGSSIPTPVPPPPPPPPAHAPAPQPSPIPPPAPLPPRHRTAPSPTPTPTPGNPAPAPSSPDPVPPPLPVLTPAQQRRQLRHQRHAHGPRPHHVVKPKPAPRPKRVHAAHAHPLTPKPKPKPKPRLIVHPHAHVTAHLRAAA